MDIIYAGTTLSYTIDYTDYPATEYTAQMVIINTSQKYTVAGTASGEEFIFAASAATTAAYVAGYYKYFIYATKDGETDMIESGTTTIRPNMLTATTYDTRSHVKKVLDALRAALEQKATNYQLQYSIAGRQIMYMTHTELIKSEAIYSRKYDEEQARENGTVSSRIRMRFR